MPNFSTPTLRAFIPLGIALSVAALIVAVLVLSSVPPVSRDALTHHLAVPELYLQHGGLVELPHIVFSYYPMNLDLLYMLALYWGNDILPKYIHFFFALLTAALIYGYLKKYLSPQYSWLGVLLFLSIPVIIKLSITVYVDLGLIFFSTAALLALLQWKAENYRLGYLLVSAILTGLALGTKYNGLISFFLLTNLVPFLYIKGAGGSGSQWRAVGHSLIFIIVALFIFSPWMIRNYLWKGNPIYPLYQSIIVPTEVPVAARPVNKLAESEDRASGEDRDGGSGGHFGYRHFAFGESGLEIALIPIRVFLHGQDDSPQYFDGVLNPYLLCFPVLAFGFIRRDADALRLEKAVLGAFAVLFLLLAFFQEDMRIRWIAPIIPPLVILTVFGLKALVATFYQERQSTWRIGGAALALIAFGAMFSLNLFYLAGLFRVVAPWDYISGKVTREAYISNFRPAYKLHEYAGRTLPDNALILALFLGHRRYYSQREIIFEETLFADLIRRRDSPHQIAAALSAKGITHLMIRRDLFEKWGAHNFNAKEAVLVQIFFNDRLKLLFSHRGYYLYKLL